MFVKAILISENRLIHLMPLKNGNYWSNRDAKEYQPIELNFNYKQDVPTDSTIHQFSEDTQHSLPRRKPVLPGKLTNTEQLENLCC